VTALPTTRQERIASLVKEIEEEAAAARERTGTQPAGAARVRRPPEVQRPIREPLDVAFPRKAGRGVAPQPPMSSESRNRSSSQTRFDLSEGFRNGREGHAELPSGAELASRSVTQARRYLANRTSLNPSVIVWRVLPEGLMLRENLPSDAHGGSVRGMPLELRPQIMDLMERAGDLLRMIFLETECEKALPQRASMNGVVELACVQAPQPSF
jgi:hypothetical protein